MSNQLQTFLSKNGTVRVFLEDDKTWFVVTDLADPLGLTSARLRQKYGELDDDERGGLRRISTPGGVRNVQVVTRQGLCSLILSCPKARQRGTRAHAFRRWVVHEVLDAIFTTGRYEIADLERRLAEMTVGRDVAVEERDVALEEVERVAVGVVQKIKEILGFPTGNSQRQWRIICRCMNELQLAALTTPDTDRVVFVSQDAMEEAIPIIRQYL